MSTRGDEPTGWYLVALIAIVVSLLACAGLLLLFTQVGNDLIMEARRLYWRLHPDKSPVPMIFEAYRALRDLCNEPS